jgi:hypothetical protein
VTQSRTKEKRAEEYQRRKTMTYVIVSRYTGPKGVITDVYGPYTFNQGSYEIRKLKAEYQHNRYLELFLRPIITV